MPKVIIDTNAILRFLLNDIPEQKIQVDQLLIKARDNKIQICLPQIVMFELNFVLEKYYFFPKQEVISSMKSLLASGYIQIESFNTFSLALNLYNKLNLSLADCFLLARAKEEQAELFTFDKKLEKLND